MLIYGTHHESKWKYISVKALTDKKDTETLQGDIDSNIYYLRILMATLVCVGAGLDCSDVKLVIRHGVPPSVLDLIQDVRQCGHRWSHLHSLSSMDCCAVLPTLSRLNALYYVHFVQEKVQKQSGEIDPRLKRLKEWIASDSKIEKYKYSNLMEMLKLFYHDIGCIHTCLQHYCTVWATAFNANLDPMGYQYRFQDNCTNACPKCTGEWNKYRMPINRIGML